MSPIRSLLVNYAWPHRLSFFGATLCLAATNYLSVTIPVQIGLAIDSLSTPETLTYIFAIFWMGLAIVVVRSLSRILFFNPARDIEYALRRDLFSHLLALQPSFYAMHNRGDIISRASNDIARARVMIGFGGLQLVNVFFALGLTTWKMFDISVSLSFGVLLPIFIGFIVVNIVIRRLYPLIRQSQEEMSAISEHILESFQGATTIQGFVAEKAFEDKFSARNHAWYATSLKISILRSFFTPLIALSSGIAVFVLIYMGGPMVTQTELSVGSIAAFVALIAIFIPYMRSLGWMLFVWQEGRSSMDRIFELLKAPLERPELESGHAVQTEKGIGPHIVINNLDFSYPDQPDKKVLHNLNLDIPAGSTVGVFGRTGSGKSTLFQVLSRCYNPPRNTVFVDGVDVCDLDIFSWRRRLTLVPQRAFLFSDSIASNISLADKPDDKRLQEAIDMASMTQDLPALPNGLETVVGERGIMLSGGQRQRVALARGLYQGGDLLLLDDVLSAVDHENESRLVSTLHALSKSEKKLTCIIVSNRISAFRHADFILVFDEGKLVSKGTHADLIAQDGIYQQAYQVQAEE